jgi:hypothetical protein
MKLFAIFTAADDWGCSPAGNDKNLSGSLVRLFGFPYLVDAVCTHGHVQHARGHGFDQASRSTDDRLECSVMGQHGDHHVPVPCHFGNGSSNHGAGFGQGGHVFRNLVTQQQFMPCAKHAPGHALAHASEPDESDFHVDQLLVVKRCGKVLAEKSGNISA